MSEMLDVITDDTVHSCMSTQDRKDHPYRCYQPKYGWGLAKRVSLDGELQARALVHTKDKIYVRSYNRDEQSDIRLEAWLGTQGYTMEEGWSIGTKLAKIRYDSRHILGPYLDGDNDSVSDEGDYFEISRSGIRFDQSSGIIEYSERTCENCDSNVSEDELYSVGYDGTDEACENCISSFTLVRGYSRYGSYREYYLHDDSSIVYSVAGTALDEDHLPDEYIVLNKGQYEGKACKEDNAIKDIDDNWWHEDDIVNDPGDDGVILITAGGYKDEYEDTDYVFKCQHDGEIYHDSDGYTSVIGGFVADCNLSAWQEANSEDSEPDGSPSDNTTQEAAHA